MRKMHPLRAMTPKEEQALGRSAKASSDRVDVVKRARSLLAVHAGSAYTLAAREAGYKSGDSVSQLVARFNEHGLVALHIAGGRGRRATYTPAHRERILTELERIPDRTTDATATWSLKTLERALRQDAELSHICASTIREALRAAGYRYTKTRTWCATGTALRVRGGQTVTVHDPKAEEKKP
jgi:transposase